MIEWCFTPLSTVFQSYHGDSSHYSRLSWVSPVLRWALKCLAQGHSHEKTQRIQCGSNPGPLDCKSNTLPLNHVGPHGASNITFDEDIIENNYMFDMLRNLSVISGTKSKNNLRGYVAI